MNIKILNKINNKNVKEKEKESFQNWLNIKEIRDNIIAFHTGQAITVLRILPINFNLKSQLEQKAILNSYRLFLKNLNSETQIIISSKKTDVSNHLNEILENTKENPLIYEMSRDYIDLVNNIIYQKNTITKEFYIVIKVSNNLQNDILKIKEYLSTCGNFVEECSRLEIVSILKNYLNKRLVNLHSGI